MAIPRQAEPAGRGWEVPYESLADGVRRQLGDLAAGESATYFVSKRCLDIVVASLVLVLIAPVALAILAALLAENGGPVLYHQVRIGRFGRRFKMYKFRTMIPDRRRASVPIPFEDRRRTLKAARDPRITPLGRALRKTSLDELPQLWNVLRGDMSLVGPRPELVEMLPYYRPEHYARHCALPGLTGWWQINGRCDRDAGISPERDLARKVADDLHYLERRSFAFDLYLLLLTVPVVVRGRGAT
jgi:lipopolysaccharide/colanic/teichoic acid biosynthesis glycosyltransferase